MHVEPTVSGSDSDTAGFDADFGFDFADSKFIEPELEQPKVRPPCPLMAVCSVLPFFVGCE